MAKDLSELQDEVIARGYTHDFTSECRSSGIENAGELRIVESVSFDCGTDPGDDATIYLIESGRGQKGYVMLSDSFHTDPRTAAFIDALLARTSDKG